MLLDCFSVSLSALATCITVTSIVFVKTASFILIGVKKVVDLCAAPGSWSQVLSRKLRFVEVHEIEQLSVFI